jgi:primosomal replication protein N
VPCVECVLFHAGQQSEAGQLRQVVLEAPAIAFESVARRLADSPLDATYRFRGFLANKSVRSTRTVFHITDFNRADLETESESDRNN